MEPLSSYSVSIQICCLSSSVASRLPSRTGPDGKTTLGPHTSDLWCLGGSSLWDSLGTLHGVVSPSGLLVHNQTPLVLVSIRVSLQVLVCGWLAASPCPPPTLPPFRQVSWLLTIPSIAPYHLSDIHCPGREQGAPARIWYLARVPLLVLEAHFLLVQHRKNLPGFWETQILGKHNHRLLPLVWNWLF